MGGDCITTHLIPLSTGIDMIEATIRIACGEKPDIEKKFDKGSAIKYFHTNCGTISSIEGVEEAKKILGVQEISFVKQAGDTVDEIGSSTDRVGFVITQGENADMAVVGCQEVVNIVTINTVK